MKRKLAQLDEARDKQACKEDEFIEGFLVRNNIISPPTPKEAAKSSVQHIVQMTNSTLAKHRNS